MATLFFFYEHLFPSLEDAKHIMQVKPYLEKNVLILNLKWSQWKEKESLVHTHNGYDFG